MDKVKLPNEVAEALRHAKFNLEWTDGNILAKCVRGDWDLESMQVLNEFCKKDDNKLLIANAIVNGYEVEQTPEDKVKEYYLNVHENLVNPNGYYGNEVRCEAVRHVLDLLNIKIEGVNT